MPVGASALPRLPGRGASPRGTCFPDEVCVEQASRERYPKVRVNRSYFMLCKQMGLNCCYCQALCKYHTSRAFWLIVLK